MGRFNGGQDDFMGRFKRSLSQEDCTIAYIKRFLLTSRVVPGCSVNVLIPQMFTFRITTYLSTRLEKILKFSTEIFFDNFLMAITVQSCAGKSTCHLKQQSYYDKIWRYETFCLTLRRLMFYIYIYIYIYIYMEHPFLMFLDHKQRRNTVGRTPLDE